MVVGDWMTLSFDDYDMGSGILCLEGNVFGVLVWDNVALRVASGLEGWEALHFFNITGQERSINMYGAS